jgi:hypothetical protein
MLTLYDPATRTIMDGDLFTSLTKKAFLDLVHAPG